jgi:hypothetical protein
LRRPGDSKIGGSDYLTPLVESELDKLVRDLKFVQPSCINQNTTIFMRQRVAEIL